MKLKFYFYILICPIENKVRYVGQTVNFESRISQHLSGNDGTFEKNRWLNMLRDKGLKPIAEIVKEKNCTPQQATKIEKTLAKKYIKEGNELFNGLINKPRANLMKGISKKYLSFVMKKSKELNISPIEYLQANKEEAKANPSFLVAEAKRRKEKAKARKKREALKARNPSRRRKT